MRSAPHSADADRAGGGYATRRLRRASGARELVRLLEAHEPRATQALGEVLDRGLVWRSCRAWIVEGERPAAAIVAARATFDRWFAMVLLLDPLAAPDAAAIVDRSPAWSVNGAAPDVAPLIPFLRRQRFVDVRPWVVTTYPNAVTAASDDPTRIASRADLDALVELYSTFEFAGGLTAWQLRALLLHVLGRHYVIVVDGPDGDLVGAVAITARTRRYGVVDLLTVLPDHRRTGRAWSLVARAQSIGNALGIAGIAALAGSNPMGLDAHFGDDRYVAVELVAPRRFRGQGRLRRIYARWRPAHPRTPSSLRSPDGPAPPGS